MTPPDTLMSLYAEALAIAVPVALGVLIWRVLRRKPVAATDEPDSRALAVGRDRDIAAAGKVRPCMLLREPHPPIPLGEREMRAHQDDAERGNVVRLTRR